MNKIEQKELLELLRSACEARTHAYVPYSHFQVGACLLASSGKRYMGCNIENAAYTPTNCAERTAVFTAVYNGERCFDALAVACSGDQPAYPCGVCRQVLAEFCEPDMPIVCGNNKGEAFFTTLGQLLPNAFGPKDLL